MTLEEMMLLKETVESMRKGNMTRKEKMIFVVGIQAGIYSDDNHLPADTPILTL